MESEGCSALLDNVHIVLGSISHHESPLIRTMASGLKTTCRGREPAANCGTQGINFNFAKRQARWGVGRGLVAGLYCDGH